MTKDNVVLFNNEDDKNVWGCISVFFDRTGQNSENTKAAYERAIRDFFLTMRRKTLEKLVEKDLIFTKPQIEKYQVNLRKKYKTTTVNSKMSAIKRCYEKFEDYGFNVRSSWFDVDRYKEHDKKSYDPMSHEEIVEAINIVSKTRAGNQKSLLIRLAYATAFRKESILSLRWTDIAIRDGVWYVKTLGKGDKWDCKKISNDLYEDLMEHKKGSDGRENIFTLTGKTVNRMMNIIRENIDFGDRRITFHSLKKSSIQEVAIITNYDLKAMQQHGNHANAATTINDYMAKKSLDDLVMVDINSHIPTESFDEMTKEQLLSLIKSSDRNTQIKLLQKMGAM